jgi:DNA-binding transcriptional ArsR family regulator
METDLEGVFRVLADTNRRRVIELLGRRSMRAGELAHEAGLSAPAMSRHLRLLLHAGVVADERRVEDARVRVFRLRPEGLVGLRVWLDDLKRDWDQQLNSFQDHVEGRNRE